VALLEKDPEDENQEEENTTEKTEEKGWFASLFGSPEKEIKEEEKKEEQVKYDEISEGTEKTENLSYMAQKTEIELGYIDTKVVEVLSGLEIGDEIVTIGNTNLRQGTPIQMKSTSEIQNIQENENDEEISKEVTENKVNNVDNSSMDNKQ
jgi:hypothetical protein